MITSRRSEAASEVLDTEVHQCVGIDCGRQPRPNLPQVAPEPPPEPGLPLVILALEVVVTELQHGEGPVVVLRQPLEVRLCPGQRAELLQRPGQRAEEELLEGHERVVDGEQRPGHPGPGPHPLPALLRAPVLDPPHDVVEVNARDLRLDSLESFGEPVPGVTASSNPLHYLLTSDSLIIQCLK